MYTKTVLPVRPIATDWLDTMKAGEDAMDTGGEERFGLKFWPNGVSEGFRPAGLSIYNNIDPDTLLREILQNSFDASRDRGCTRVRFSLERISPKSIPGYRDYQKHFEAACTTQKELGTFEQATSIAERMDLALRSEDLLVLWVSDNGVGLNNRNMNSLLGDGQSQKSDAADTGSYGNGHVTVFPASDLRYLVYGGVFNEDGQTKRIVSGHTILATHKIDDEIYGKDGFLVSEINRKDLFSRYHYYETSANSILGEKLDWIEKSHGTGACIGIMGFNRFNRFDNDQKVVEVIERVSATHFLPAIYNGRMEIEIQTESSNSVVDVNSLSGILERDSERLRRRQRSIGPSGKQTWEALQTLSPRYKQSFNTQNDTVDIYFRDKWGGYERTTVSERNVDYERSPEQQTIRFWPSWII